LNQITADERAASPQWGAITAQQATPIAGTSAAFSRVSPASARGFEADEIFYILPQTLVDRDKKIIRARFFFFRNFQPLLCAPFSFAQ